VDQELSSSEKDSYQILVNKLFELPFVRYAVVTDDFGRRFVGGMKPGISSTTPIEIEKMLETQAVLILKMAEGYVPYDGSLLWSSIHWEKVVALFFLLGQDKGTLSVTLEGTSSLESALQVHKLVEDWKNAKSR
jgi:hypothetical protein